MDISSLPQDQGSQTRRSPLQQRVASATLEAAARLFAAGDEQSSMSDVAELAGGGRATLYRYVPKRQTLLTELDARVGGRGSTCP